MTAQPHCAASGDKSGTAGASANRTEIETLTVAQAGERRVLTEILSRIPTGTPLLGPGDDAAIVAAPDGRFAVTVDTMIEGPDFRREWSTARQLGSKAVTTNLSDIAAMGAVPSALVIALAVPRDTRVSWVAEFADGVAAQLRQLAPGCGVVGGDLATAEHITISVTAFGDLQGRDPITRSGARPGDQIAVAGTLGRAAAGLHLLFRGETDPLTAVQLAPESPISAGVAAAFAGATAMMDLSDGLLLDGDRMAAASGVALDFSRELLHTDIAPLAERFGPELAEQFVLGGGEDHSLLATFAGDAELPRPFRRIGTVRRIDTVRPIDTARQGCGTLVDGEPADPAGWDPFVGVTT